MNNIIIIEFNKLIKLYLYYILIIFASILLDIILYYTILFYIIYRKV
jgi:hypothetical protein